MEVLKATDLRIGNLVCKSLKSGNGRKLNQKITIADFERIEESITFNYEPISLNEQWLLDLGFEEDENLFHNQIALYKNGIGGFNYNVNYFEHENLYEISSVHQLQNLYFALTNEELTLKSQ